ncbi:unnamed protein product [Toxocara canis]|uniref:Teneurin N-terminal domain-containing protein n=1 Tax=Toxocara canis TaxID=6265 RepID=A0A183V3D0_TOXCA|nr:unnamed protein product [Toxocara canis]
MGYKHGYTLWSLDNDEDNDFPSNLPTMSPHMRRSVPTLAQGRHLSSSGSSGPPSRGSFVESSQQNAQWTSRNTRSFKENELLSCSSL